MLDVTDVNKFNNQLEVLSEDDVIELLGVLEKQYEDDKMKYDRMIREKHGGIYDHPNNLINDDEIVLDELKEKIKLTKNFIELNFDNSMDLER